MPQGPGQAQEALAQVGRAGRQRHRHGTLAQDREGRNRGRQEKEGHRGKDPSGQLGPGLPVLEIRRHGQHDEQAGQTAEVSDRPAPSRDLTHLPAGGDLRQEGVVEDQPALETDIGQDEKEDPRDVIPPAHEKQKSREADAEAGVGHQEALLGPRVVGHGAQNG